MRVLSYIVPAVIITVLFCCCKDRVAESNAHNIKQLEVGMTLHEVDSIMGAYQQIDTMIFNGEKAYELTYKAPSFYSGDFIVYISQNDCMVISIYDGL